jgi:glycosyltransferase involved in cell wall biosynthesis
MMRVAFVSKNLLNPLRGAQSAGRDWFKHLTSKQTEEFQIVPVVPRKSKISKFSGTPFDNIQWCISSTISLHDICKTMDIDVIHIHSYGGNITIPPRGIPTVVSFHDEPVIRNLNYLSAGFVGIMNGLLTLIEEPFRILLRSKNVWIHAPSSTIKRQFVNMGITNSRISVIPNSYSSIDVQFTVSKNELFSRYNLPEDARIVLTVGTISVRKAIHRLIAVAEAYQQIDDTLHFLIVGKFSNILDRAYAKSILSEISKRKIKNIRLLGYVPDEILDALWKLSALYVSVSMSEACNLALLEAANAGLPIVSTCVGSAYDLFSEGRIVSRSPTTRELIQAIEIAKCQRRVSYQRVKSMQWAQLADSLIDYYRLVLDESKEPF